MDSSPVSGRATRRLHLCLVGVAGTSRDILLAVYSLCAYLSENLELGPAVAIDVIHHPYVLPSQLDAKVDALALQVIERAPDVVGFSVYTWNFDVVVATAARVRAAMRDVIILFGGPEVDAKDILQGRYDRLAVDFLVAGEGELPLRAFVSARVENRDPARAGIPRLACRVGGTFAFAAATGAKEGVLPEISSLPSPYLLALVPDELLARQGTQANFESQRGCNLRCAYCLYHANFPSIRYRDPIVVADEIELTYRKGVRACRITDANFFSNAEHAHRLLSELVRRRLEMSLFLEVIPSFIDAEAAALLRQYGAISPSNKILVGIGLQTTTQASLKAIRRTLPVSHFTRAFEYLNHAGAVVKTDIILGLPHETRESYMRLMEYLAEQMREGFNYVSVALLRVLPGTELHRIAEQAGLNVEADSEHFVYETPTMPRKDMLACMKITGVLFRFFHTLDDGGRIQLRERFYQTKERLGVTHAQMLEHFVRFLDEHFRGRESDWVRPDFPRAEHYWYFQIDKEVSNEVLLDELAALDRGASVLQVATGCHGIL